MFTKIPIPRKKHDAYELLLQILPSLISEDDDEITILANSSSAIKYFIRGISWVGFYLYKDGFLKLGPFQGLPACTKIKIGEGVCGSSFLQKETIIVKDVRTHPNHIACDAQTKSEIVIPLIVNHQMYGVLDLDSYRLSHFTKTDQHYLEQVAHIITQQLNKII